MPELPQVLAGPIVRRVDAVGVSVWIALDRRPTNLTLAVLEGTAAWDAANNTKDTSDPSTVRVVCLGVGLFVALLRIPWLKLSLDKIYQYDIVVDTDAKGTTKSLLDGLDLGLAPMSRPSFLRPRTVASGLRIAHASCRKPHGGGYDALPLLYRALLDAATVPATRPQQLYLTGDQVYADDVTSDMLYRISEYTDLLFGWEERLGADADFKPVSAVGTKKAGDDAASKVHMCPRKAIRGNTYDRSQFLQAVGFKGRSDRPGERDYYTHHLLGFQEWCAMYLLAWSERPWALTKPYDPDFAPPKRLGQDFMKERTALDTFRSTLPSVRKVLANIATYMIFDDHDVTDDWFMPDQRVRLNKDRPVPARIIRNALLAYAVFQDWGNQPDDYAEGKPGAQLLSALESSDLAPTGLIPPFIATKDVTIRKLLNADGANDPAYTDARKRWNYHYKGDGFDAVVLDSRTWRGPFPKLDALITPSAAKEQLKPLAGTDRTRPLILVSPAPLAGFIMVEIAQRAKMSWRDTVNPLLTESGDEALDAEAWHFNGDALNSLIGAVRGHRDKIVVLSGDVHYAYSEQAGRRPKTADVKPGVPPTYDFLQLCSSSSKNSEMLTRVLGLSDLLLTSPLNPLATPELTQEQFSDALTALEINKPDLTETATQFRDYFAAKAGALAFEISQDRIAAAKKYSQSLIDSLWAAVDDESVSIANRTENIKRILLSCLPPVAPATEFVEVEGHLIPVVGSGNGPRNVHLDHLVMHPLVDKRGDKRYDPDPRVKAWYATQRAKRGPFLIYLNYLSIGDTNIGIVQLQRRDGALDVLHSLRWTMPLESVEMLHLGQGPYPAMKPGQDPPWVSTLHTITI